MNVSRFASRNWFALSLVALHAMLVAAYAWIELDHAWNDMNPTMLVMAGLHIVDFPIHQLLNPLIDVSQHLGTYLAALLLVGSAFWFAVGTLLTYAFRSMRSIFIGTRPAMNAA